MKSGAIIFMSALLVMGCGGGDADVGVDAGGAGGKSGDAGQGTCRANTPAGASVSWREDGVPKCAVSVVAQRSSEATGEILQLQGVTLDGASAAFAVITYGRPLEGTHACGTTADAGLVGTPGTVYVDFVRSGTRQTCSVTITNGGVVGGAHATGTFSATFTGNGGAVVTNGIFDTPVKAPPNKQ